MPAPTATKLTALLRDLSERGPVGRTPSVNRCLAGPLGPAIGHCLTPVSSTSDEMFTERLGVFVR